MNHFKSENSETVNCFPVVCRLSVSISRNAIYSHQSRQLNENKSQVLNVKRTKNGIKQQQLVD